MDLVMNRKYGIWIPFTGLLYFVFQLFVAPGPLIWDNPALLGGKYGIISVSTGIVVWLFLIQAQKQLSLPKNIEFFYNVADE